MAVIYFVLLSGCTQLLPGTDDVPRGVVFSFLAPSSSSVAIAGSFNQWDPKRDQFSGPDKKGVWKIALPLSAGRYEYLFVINGNEWVPDPAAPKVDDGLGGANSLVVVSP